MITSNVYIEIVDQVGPSKFEATKWVLFQGRMIPFLPLQDIPNGSRNLETWFKHAEGIDDIFHMGIGDFDEEFLGQFK